MCYANIHMLNQSDGDIKANIWSRILLDLNKYLDLIRDFIRLG